MAKKQPLGSACKPLAGLGQGSDAHESLAK
jgi:hypothetical protein